MNGLRRAFLAVVPPPDVLRWTDSLVDTARADDDGLRWSRTDQRHLTLQFLGGVIDADALVEAVTDAIRQQPAFTLALAGAGAFPTARRASVLWLGAGDGSGELTALAEAIARATAPLGFVADERPYRPHLTVARSGRARDLRAVVAELDVDPGPTWTVDDVVLFESDTRADGAVHTARARLALGR